MVFISKDFNFLFVFAYLYSIGIIPPVTVVKEGDLSKNRSGEEICLLK